MIQVDRRHFRIAAGEITEKIKRSCGQAAANQNILRKSHIARHAAVIAWVLKWKLTIDLIKETFIDDAEANQLRYRPFRNWRV